MSFPYYLGIGIIVFIVLLIIYLSVKKDDPEKISSDEYLNSGENTSTKVTGKAILWVLFIAFACVDTVDKIKGMQHPLDESFSIWDLSLFLTGLFLSVIMKAQKD